MNMGLKIYLLKKRGDEKPSKRYKKMYGTPVKVYDAGHLK
jgi:hypothetical protein